MNNNERINATIGRLALFACTGNFSEDRGEIAHFIRYFLDVEDRAEQAEACNARYNALLEERETSRPREYLGYGEDLPSGTVVLDCDGDAWQCGGAGTWYCVVGRSDRELPGSVGPYTIIHTPKEDS
jgi:hypothetical protein|nr:MAG TPA: hypothetical protein [Caudoviricetes sp.]